MKKLITALALLLVVTAGAARAERILYAAQGTLTPAQGERIAALLEEAGMPFALRLQEETGESLELLVMTGRAPQLALVPAAQAMRWAREGLLMPLDGCAEELGRIAQPLTDACVWDERLMAAPLFVHLHQMAVNPKLIGQAMMGYLLDARAHPVWYPSEFVQVLDELALLGGAGMAVWPPQEGGALYMEALLQGVSGLCLADEETGAYAADEDALTDALLWLEDMCFAGLISAQESREAALESFLSGETAIFPDWTQADSAAFAEEIRSGRIVLLPYPSLDGRVMRAAELVVLCAFFQEDPAQSALLARAAAVLCQAPRRFFGPVQMYEDGARWLPQLEALEYGPTLRQLLCAAAGGVIRGEADAQQEALKLARVMDALHP